MKENLVSTWNNYDKIIQLWRLEYVAYYLTSVYAAYSVLWFAEW